LLVNHSLVNTEYSLSSLIHTQTCQAMKKFLILAIPVLLTLASCTKQSINQPPVDEAEWLQRPRGRVIESDFSCSYFIVENNWGYSVLRMFGGGAPFRGSVVYGYHNQLGMTTFYNRSGGYVFQAQVLDYGLSYFQALDMVSWNCDPFQ